MKESDAYLDKLLKEDPIELVEEITGRKFDGTSEEDFALSFQAMHLHNQIKEGELRERDDSTFSTPYQRYIRILKDEGFEKIYHVDFKIRNKNEFHEIWFNEEGALLINFDTYSREEDMSINSSTLYFNVEATNEDAIIDLPWSGVWIKGTNIVSGKIDTREALRHNLKKLRENTLLSPWIDTPFLWLLNYGDTQDAQGKDIKYDYEELNRKRISSFPTQIAQIIDPKGKYLSKELD